MRHVYLDWNATTPPHPDVLDAMRAATEVAWANPASVHGPGRRARAFVEEAREAVAALSGFHPRDVVLTSGGTEANNLALALPFADLRRPLAESPAPGPLPAATPDAPASASGQAPRRSGRVSKKRGGTQAGVLRGELQSPTFLRSPPAGSPSATRSAPDSASAPASVLGAASASAPAPASGDVPVAVSIAASMQENRSLGAPGVRSSDMEETSGAWKTVLLDMEQTSGGSGGASGSCRGGSEERRGVSFECSGVSKKRSGVSFECSGVSKKCGGVSSSPEDVLSVSEAGGLGSEEAGSTLSGSSAGRAGRAAMVVSRIEHPSIVRMAEELGRWGVVVEWVEPEPSGRVAAAGFAAAVGRLRADGVDVRLLVLQAVNHETGVVQPVAEVAAIARGCGALLHVDAVQAVGRLPASSWEGADMVSVAAHKIRGPKGIGALCTRPGLKVRPLLFGGAQERGLRPGTQDPVAAAGFAAAARRALAGGPARYAEVAGLRDRLEAALVALSAEAGGARALINGEPLRAPHLTNLSWPGWRGDELCAALDLEGVAVSSGSACSAGTAEPSPVIRAMVGLARAEGAVRLSLGEDTTEADITRALEAFRRILGRQRASGPPVSGDPG